MIKAKIWQEWKKEWEWYPEARQAHYLIGGPSQKFNQIYKLGRESISPLIQYVTGHAFLGRHDRIVELGNGTEAATCRFCKAADETPHHVLTKCEPLALRRHDWFANQTLPTYFFKWKLYELLGFMELSDLDTTPLNQQVEEPAARRPF